MNELSEMSIVSKLYGNYRNGTLTCECPSLMRGFPCEALSRVTSANWMFPPHNVWGFRNAARLRPTIDVARGEAPVTPLKPKPVALDLVNFQSVCGEAVSVADHLVASHTDGFIIVQDDEVLFERYANGQTASDRHLMFSVTKSLIGLLAEKLVTEGVLHVERLVIDYVPELGGSAYRDATVAQLLDMAVGVQFSEVYDDPSSESSQYGRACGIYPPLDGAENHESLYQFLPSLQQSRPHGGFFHYVTATTEVLAWVMERASGHACAQQLQTVWSQIGCERDGHFLADSWGRNVAGAGFSATLRDMARIGRFIANEGVHDGLQLFPADAISRILAGTNPAYLGANPSFAKWTPGASYKSQWYVFNDEAMMAGGVHGQYLFIHPKSKIVIVKQSSLPEAVTLLDQDSVAMFKALVKEIQS